MAYQSKHKKSAETLLVIEGVSFEGLSLREFDRAVSERFGSVCGIDEAGRGPVAGAVYAAAVILDPNDPIEGLDDSKKLTPKKREKLSPIIKEKALAYCIASASVEEIDKTDILSADMLAMQRAFEGLKEKAGIVLVDGDVLPGLSCNSKNVIGGDAKSEAIAAASILAKVERDAEMCRFAEKYPGYGFEKHKGYGTRAHLDAIKERGLCPIHRKSFLKKYIKENE